MMPGLPSNNEVHARPENFYKWLSIISLNIPPGHKSAIFFNGKDCQYSFPFMEVVYEISPDNPHFLGYIFPNERNEIMTGLYPIYWSVFEIDDQKNQVRSEHMYANECYSKYRRFKDSSVIDSGDAINHLSTLFSTWDHTKEMWTKIDANKQKPGNNGSIRFFYSNS